MSLCLGIISFLSRCEMLSLHWDVAGAPLLLSVSALLHQCKKGAWGWIFVSSQKNGFIIARGKVEVAGESEANLNLSKSHLIILLRGSWSDWRGDFVVLVLQRDISIRFGNGIITMSNEMEKSQLMDRCYSLHLSCLGGIFIARRLQMSSTAYRKCVGPCFMAPVEQHWCET